MKDKLIFNLKDITELNNEKILNSLTFNNLLDEYIKENKSSYKKEQFLSLFNKIIKRNPTIITSLNSLTLKEKEKLLNEIDDIYDFYRNKERYLLSIRENNNNLTHRQFIDYFNKFSDSIVNFYRDIYEFILGKEQTVYRILPSGANVGVIFEKFNLPLLSSYSYLKDIPLLESIINQPPFLISSKENKRHGIFHFEDNKIIKEDINEYEFYSVLIKINGRYGIIYLHQDYLSFLVSIGNLFEVVTYGFENIKNIDFIVFFGTDKGEDCYYYKEMNTYIGVLPKKYNIDYFGYLKKIILTLYNLKMIEENNLPIHGAGFSISDGNKKKNFVLLGDSGAGKSETLEAIKNEFNNKYKISPIFDDMGTFFIKNNIVYTSGTETGAFVRLDDLDQSYSLKSIDRAIFFNIDQANSRVVMPLLSYSKTSSLYKVDGFFLADNYSNNENKLIIYEDLNEALVEFKEAKRVAMNTTNEVGLVSTYFANPFGPLQEKEKVETFIKDYFITLKKQGASVGKLSTSLSFDKKNGPALAAHALIDYFNSLKD